MPTISTPADTSTSAVILLNPVLTAALSLAFPEEMERFRIYKSGIRRIENENQLSGSSRPIEYGEEYRMNCPFCRDRRHRMRISYTYDPSHSNYRWKCFNEQCEKRPECRATLTSRLQHVWARAKQLVQSNNLPEGIQSAAASANSASNRRSEPSLPAGTSSLSNLDINHPARQFIISRGFDVETIASRWFVGFTSFSISPLPIFSDRIVIPFACRDETTIPTRWKLLGWLARSIETDSQPQNASQSQKYLTMAGMRTSELLYTNPNGVLQSDRLIVVEGVTDAWRCGEDTVALLGKTASSPQLALLVREARSRRTILVALDADAEAESLLLIGSLQTEITRRKLNIHVVRCRPPVGKKDFGECSAAEANEALNGAFATASIAPILTKVSWSEARTRVNVRNHHDRLASDLCRHATGRTHMMGDDLDSRIAELGMSGLLQNVEEPLVPLLKSMESTGLLVDRGRLDHFVREDTQLGHTANRLRRGMCSDTSRVFTTLNQLGTCTGRITSSEFSLQNLDRELRQAIIADSGRMMILADYSTFEWRIAAELSRDPFLLRCLANPTFDLFADAARMRLGTAMAVTTEFRNDTKSRMMRFLYSDDRRMDRSLEGQFVASLREHLPDLLQWRSRFVEDAIRSNAIRTPFGRTVALDAERSDADKFNQAFNRMIQATAADFFKYALLAIRQALPAEARLLLPHHDAILLDCPTDKAGVVQERLRVAMEAPIPGLSIPFPVKIRNGTNWFECTNGRTLTSM